MDTGFVTNPIFWLYIVPIIILLAVAWLALALYYQDEKRAKWLDDLKKWKYAPDVTITLITWIIAMGCFLLGAYFTENQLSQEISQQNSNKSSGNSSNKSPEDSSNNGGVNWNQLQERIRFIFAFLIVFLLAGFFIFYYLQNAAASFFCFVFAFLMIAYLSLEYLNINNYGAWLLVPLLVWTAWYIHSMTYLLSTNPSLNQSLV